MRTSVTALIVLAFSALLSGCDQLQHSGSSQTPGDALPHGNYAMTSTSADGTFLLDSQSGKVWRYSTKDDAFLEVVVTSKILRYERGPDGKPHLVHPETTPTTEPDKR